MTLAAGIWLEGVNFAIGSGLAAGRAVAGRPRRRRHARPGAGRLPGRPRVPASCWRTTSGCRRAPALVLSERIQSRYPGLVCDLVEGLFTVTNPEPKPGGIAHGPPGGRRHGVTLPGPGGRHVQGHEDLPVSRDRSPARPAGPHLLRRPDGHRRVPGGRPGPHRRRLRHLPVVHHRACVTACPANLFAPTADGGILFNYEECFECGTCYMVCNHDGGHHLDLPRRRPRCRLPPRMRPVATRLTAPRWRGRLRRPGRPPPGRRPPDGALVRRPAPRRPVRPGRGRRRARLPHRRGLGRAGDGGHGRAALGTGGAGRGGRPGRRRRRLVDGAPTPVAELVQDEHVLARALAAACGPPGRRGGRLRRPVTRPGTGALPAFLAHELAAAQALGLVTLTTDGHRLAAERRLDGGWRERLTVPCPAVCSVEAAGVRLRRAPSGRC